MDNGPTSPPQEVCVVDVWSVVILFLVVNLHFLLKNRAKLLLLHLLPSHFLLELFWGEVFFFFFNSFFFCLSDF